MLEGAKRFMNAEDRSSILNHLGDKLLSISLLLPQMNVMSHTLSNLDDSKSCWHVKTYGPTQSISHGWRHQWA